MAAPRDAAPITFNSDKGSASSSDLRGTLTLSKWVLFGCRQQILIKKRDINRVLQSFTIKGGRPD